MLWSTALALCMAASCGTHPRKLKVLMIGDSITDGSSGTGATYAAQLSKRLQGKHEILNVAVGGSTTRDWANRAPTMPYVDQARGLFDAQVPALAPFDVVTVMLGTNDALGFFETAPLSADEYEASLSTLIQRLLELGASRVVLVSPPPYCEHPGLPEARARLHAYARRMRGLCARDTHLVCGPDPLRLVDPVRDYDGTKDCIHPLEAGHRKVADALAAVLADLAE
jgi:lysophospholipase L1-like esterase